MSERQVVVFVRVNNMATLETEGQRTFIVDLDGGAASVDVCVGAALAGARRQWESSNLEAKQ